MSDLSTELCGGTHVRTTGQVGAFHFLSESGVAAGVRRIEAVTGLRSLELVRQWQDSLGDAADRLNTQREHVTRKIASLLEDRKKLERQVEDLLKSGGAGAADDSQEFEVDDVMVRVASVPENDRNQIGMMADAHRDKNNGSVLVVFGGGGRPGIHAAVTDDLVSKLKAGDIVRRIAEVTGGKGGGRPHFASAGVGSAELVAEARKQTPEIIREMLVGRGG